MTREERELAIEELQGCIIAEEHGKDGKPNGNVTCELTKDTIDLVIKALEQEPKTKIEESNFSQEQYLADIQSAYDCGKSVLDKIYTDIQGLRGCSCSCSDGIIDDVEDILDKYKAESKPQESEDKG